MLSCFGYTFSDKSMHQVLVVLVLLVVAVVGGH